MREKNSKKDNEQTSQNNGLGKQFICQHCCRTIEEEVPGTHHRNHCPSCLRSVHLDNRSGDRASSCGCIMEPIAISIRWGKEWLLIHRCTGCGTLRENRIAGDDNELALLSLAVRPLSQPPFPLDRLNVKPDQ